MLSCRISITAEETDCSTKESERTKAIHYNALQHFAAKSPAIDKKSAAIDGKPTKINSNCTLKFLVVHQLMKILAFLLNLSKTCTISKNFAKC